VGRELYAGRRLRLVVHPAGCVDDLRRR
jgi:hypothetical protein